jgi:hypothetical protein
MVFGTVNFAAALPNVLGNDGARSHVLAYRSKMNHSIESNSQGKMHPVTSGRWGGQSISFTVEKNLVDIQFDCAQGQIPRQLKADKNGVFRVEGTLTRQSPGPIRRDAVLQQEPAIYEGKIKGDVMTLKVTLKKTRESAGEFTIEHGRNPTLHRCY